MRQSKRFFPGAIDYDGRVSAGYERARALPSEAASTWAAILAAFLRPPAVARILDLGAGTGRFSTLLAHIFDRQVVGVEPSKRMLAIANDGARQMNLANLAYVAGAAECIPLRDKTCDLAWLSNVWHHIRDHQACGSELRRVVSRDGHVLVRGAFGDRLDGFPILFRYWPAARDICEQLPTIQQTVGVFEANGFALTGHRRVPQTTCASLGEFAGRTRLRADTALALISDTEFQDGQATIEQAAALERIAAPVIEVIELLAFRKHAESTGGFSGRAPPCR